MTPRIIISKALVQWINIGDPALGSATSVKLEHIGEGRPPKKLDSWAVAGKGDIQRLINAILDCAQEHVSGASSRTQVEEFYITPYFGEGAGTEGGHRRFFLRATTVGGEVDGEGLVGDYSEGPTKVGQIHQGMRHLEAMTKIHVEGVARLEASRQAHVDQLLKDNEMLRNKLAEAERGLEEAKDKSLERKLMIFRANQEEERKDKIVEAVIPAAMQLANGMTGMPIFPVNTDNSTLIGVRNWLLSWTKDEIKNVSASLAPEKRFVFESMMAELLKQEREAQAAKNAEAQTKVNGSPQDPKTVENLAKRTPQAPTDGAT